MLRNIYGSLKVIGYDDTTHIATVRCGCGNVEGVNASKLIGGRTKCCRKCIDAKKYIDSITVDMALLNDLSPDIAARLLQRFAHHLELSHKNDVRATSFATFVKEKLGDPDFVADNPEEPDQSFDARLMRSNPQSYRQYQPPTTLTIK